MFSEKLKQETSLAHQSLEKIIIRQIKAIQTTADYRKLLQFFYSYYQPLEQLLEPFFNNNIIPQYAERRKAAAILYDIQQIPGAETMPENCSDLPWIQNTADAVGALYVLEGSTLGGAFIAKMLYKQAAIPENQLSFFTGYAEKSMNMWAVFVDAINKYAEEDGTGEEIMAAARQTFEKMKRWAIFFYNPSPETAGSPVA